MRSNVVLAVFKRNVSSYFSGMLGYLFIVVFVVAGAFLAFDEDFFANNLANLDRLSGRFPLLLLFIIPAITMTAWADERKLGTDELLFTLPASDFEILLGKYLAVLAVYTVALAFSLTHALVLRGLGRPDWGLIATTYLGYWLAGGALLAAGMFASVLTSSATVAFVLGTAICAIPVFIDKVPGISSFLRDTLKITEPLSVSGHLAGFTSGKMTFSGLFYFVGLAAFFLYLNAVMIARRHWAGGKDSRSMSWQFVARVACLAIVLLSLTYSLAVAGRSLDTTTERLHTLSPTTIEILRKIPDDKPVTIQAFLSPNVPQGFVPIRKELVNLLNEYHSRGGKNVQVRIVDVDPYSKESEEAEALGVTARQIQSEEGGRYSQEEIYLGLVLSSGYDRVVIPFFERGTPIEYELTRSIGTISHDKRPVVGVLNTDAKPNGGMDTSQGFRQLPKWQLVRELEKQYDVKDVSPDSAITTEMDVLVAILPSSLTQPQMEHLVTYVKSGKPVLIFDDPAPFWGPGGQSSGISMAPLEPKPSPGGMMMQFQQRSEPKADGGEATSLSEALGIRWNVHQSLFDEFNPHPKFSQAYPKELIFLIGRENFNEKDPITSGLQEMITFAPGAISGRDSNVDVDWLIKSRKSTVGLNDWDKITRSNFIFGKQYTFDAPHRLTDESYVIAARIKGKNEEQKVNAIFVADVDLVNDIMFSVWQQQLLDFKIDNVLFVLNCVDALAGDERFIELRKRRAVHRTLTLLEQKKKKFETERSNEVKAADEAADKALDKAKKNLEEVLANLRKELETGNVDVASLQVRLDNAQEAENRKLEQKEKEIERDKKLKIRQVQTSTQQEIKRIERGVWRWAVLLPPLPAVLLGIIVVLSKLMDERQGIASDRRLRD